MTEPVLHITTRSAWEEAQKTGLYTPASFAAEGFIHCSRGSQVVRVAEAYYPGRKDLVLLVIDPSQLTSELRYEPGTDRPDELFPHIYGPLKLEAVIQWIPFEPGADGRFHLPSLPSLLSAES